MIKLTDLLTEGVFDKGILKAVFMAGGPGSGTSYDPYLYIEVTPYVINTFIKISSGKTKILGGQVIIK